MPKASKINFHTVQFAQLYFNINWQNESTDIDTDGKIWVLLALIETVWAIWRTITQLEKQAGLLNTFILGSCFCGVFFFTHNSLISASPYKEYIIFQNIAIWGIYCRYGKPWFITFLLQNPPGLYNLRYNMWLQFTVCILMAIFKFIKNSGIYLLVEKVDACQVHRNQTTKNS